MRELDDPNLTGPALNLDLCDAKHTVVVFASVSGVDPNIAELFETKPLYEFNRQCKLGCPRVDQQLALNFLALLIRRQVPVLPVSDFCWHTKYAHVFFYSGF